MNTPSDYGRWCYVVKFRDGTDMMLAADEVEITDGVAIFWYSRDRSKRILYALPQVVWERIYAASTLDGRPIAVDWEADANGKMSYKAEPGDKHANAV